MRTTLMEPSTVLNGHRKLRSVYCVDISRYCGYCHTAYLLAHLPICSNTNCDQCCGLWAAIKQSIFTSQGPGNDLFSQLLGFPRSGVAALSY